MLFKPDTKEGAKEGAAKKSRGRGFVMTLITLAILSGLGYYGWTTWHQQPQQANRQTRSAVQFSTAEPIPTIQSQWRG